MDLHNYIQAIEIHLIQTHAAILKWFDKPTGIKQFRPRADRWSILEILEHVSLTSHFLLKLIDKGAAKAQRNVKGLSIAEELECFDFDLDKLDAIGQHGAFSWIRPEHMEPTGQKAEEKIKAILIDQLNRCLTHLQDLRKGEGLLYQMTMTVQDLGKINVYEFIYFLSKHAERHLAQMGENEDKFKVQSEVGLD